MATAVQQDAIVLRALRYGEADAIVHLFTRESGRRNAIAKGIRRARSRSGARLEPFTIVRLMLRQGRGDLAFVQGNELIDAHEPIRASYELQQRAAAALDMLGRVTVEHAANEPAYHLTTRFLGTLGSAADQGTLTLLAYQLKLLHVAGLAPQLGACTRCGATTDLVAWTATDGGMICAGCQVAGDQSVPPSTVQLAMQIMRDPLAQVPSPEAFAPGDVQRVRQIVTGMCREHAGFQLRSVGSS